MRRPLALVPILLLVGASAVPFPAAANETTLPGGTPISVTMASPADEAVLPPGPVTITGQAEIGKGQPRDDTALTYVLDVSGSTSRGRGCGGDPNNDQRFDDVLDCEIAAAIKVNDRAVDVKTVDKVSVVVFGTRAATADVGPEEGNQVSTDPEAVSGGARHVDTVLKSAFNDLNDIHGGVTQFTADGRDVGGLTSFVAAINATAEAVKSTSKRQRLVVFMSDGIDALGGDIEQALRGVPADVKIFTFAIGGGSECGTANQGDVTLQRIADATHGACDVVTNLAELPDRIPGVIASRLTALSLRIDNVPVEAAFQVTPPLPQPGPATVDYRVTTSALPLGRHTLCVRATGADGGGGGSVDECHTITVNAPPVVKAGGPYTGTHGKPVKIDGTLDDDEPRAKVTWSADPRAGCTFADEHALSTTVTCTEQGSFELTLTAKDDFHPPVSSSTRLTVVNESPVVSAGGPYSGVEDQPVPITGTATDPDDPRLTVTWSVPEGTPCAFGDPAALSTTVTCTEHGTFDLTLSASDGKHPPVIATTTVNVVNQVPKVSAGGPYTGQDNIPVPITGTAVDPDSPGLTTRWEITRVTGEPDTVCAIGNPAQLSTVVTCTGGGIFTLTLTVDDGVNGPVVARTTLTLGLRPGALSLATFVNLAPGFVGGDPVVVTHTVRNGGVQPMKSVKLITTLPAGLKPLSTNPAGCTGTCDLGTLAPGQTVQVTFTFAVTAAMDQPLSALLTTAGPDLDQSDNATSTRVVVRKPTLSVDPAIGPQGFVTRATGKDFPAGARVQLRWSIGISETPGEVVVRPDGTLDSQVLIFPKDARGLRVLSAIPVSGPKFGDVQANPFLVVARSLKPKTFIVR